MEIDRRPTALRWEALATALRWIDFRNLPSFKDRRPRLMRWYGAFIDRPSMQATDYSGETHD